MNENKWKSNRGLKIGLTVISLLTAAVMFFSGVAVILIGNVWRGITIDTAKYMR